jgi:hypothetical protein
VNGHSLAAGDAVMLHDESRLALSSTSPSLSLFFDLA